MSQAIGLIRRGFHEVPHLMFGSGIFIFSGIYGYIAIRRHIKYEKSKRNWKRRYTVYREGEFDQKDQVHPIDKKYPVF